MQRRGLLKLGFAATSALAVAGGVASLLNRPPAPEASLSSSALGVLASVSTALLEGSLPAEAQERKAALPAYFERLTKTVSALPPDSRRQLEQVLSLLSLPPGRWALAGLATPWSGASPQELRDALDTMRTSHWLQRRQIYHVLRDLSRAAWYAAPSAWSAIGYPGPRAIA